MVPLVFPAAMLIVFFVAPFGTMIAVSFFKRQQGGFYTPGFVFDNYARFLSPFFGGVLTFSLFLSITVAVVAVAIATPFTYLLVRSSRRAQVAWLVGAARHHLALGGDHRLCLVDAAFAHRGHHQYPGCVGTDERAAGADPRFRRRAHRHGLPDDAVLGAGALSRDGKARSDVDRSRAHARRLARARLLQHRPADAEKYACSPP